MFLRAAACTAFLDECPATATCVCVCACVCVCVCVCHPLQPVGAAAAGIAAAHMTAMVGGPANPGPTQSRVNGLLGGMTPLQLYETVGQMRSQIRQDPERARQTLINNPQLTKALFQAQVCVCARARVCVCVCVRVWTAHVFRMACSASAIYKAIV